MALTTAQIKLIRDFEPILFFHGGDANVGAERFFPSDAKRYVEHCALWKARDPFLSMTDWQSLRQRLPANPRSRQARSPSLPVERASFSARRRTAATNFYKHRRPDLYQTDLELNASQFWYHAEFFDAVRLRLLFDFVHDQGGQDLMQLFAAHLGEPAVLTEPALICYYLFFPGHEEGLAGCAGVAEARNYANFAGEWACVAVLFDPDTPDAAYMPKQVGLTRRNVGVIKFGGREVRSSMRIFPWSAMQPHATTHPRLIVARGSHDLYLPGEVPKPLEPLTQVDPSAGSCGLAELPAAQMVGLKNPITVGQIFPFPNFWSVR
jgi:hypothetical protein